METLGRQRTTSGAAELERRPVDWLPALAADLDTATRVAMRLRPDGLVEVSVANGVMGFVDHVPPVFVAYAGVRADIAVEVAQCATLARAVDALRV